MTAVTKRGRFGLRTYARILALIAGQPLTQIQVAEAIGSGVQTMREVLWMMVRLRLAHVSGWHRPDAKRRPYLRALFAAGDGESVSYPVQIRRQPLGSGVGGTRSELIHFAAIVRELSVGATRAEIMERCGTAYCNLTPLLREMRSLGLVRVAAWQPNEHGGGKPAQVIKLERGADAPKPRALSARERQRRYNNRRRVLRAQVRVMHAVAGLGAVVVTGPQSYRMGTTT